MKEPHYKVLRGEVVTPPSLRLSRAQAVGRLLDPDQNYPFVKLVECRRVEADPENTQSEYAEMVVFDVEVEVSQAAAHDIRRSERMVVMFRESDRFPPEAFALREDFPTNLPHLNLRPVGDLPSLCLSNRTWAEDRLQWTARRFIEDIRMWLSLTAQGILHQEDQPLEQLLFGLEAAVILPTDIFDSPENMPQRLYCHRTSGHESDKTIVAIASREPFPGAEGGAKFIVLPLGVTSPVTHGVIKWSPTNLNELQEFFQDAGFDLISVLRERLISVSVDTTVLELTPVLIITVPKRRTDDGALETAETFAFLVGKTLGEIGVELGIFQKFQKLYVPLYVHLLGDANHVETQVESIQVAMMRPYFCFDRNTARRSSGLPATDTEPKIVAIGMGALGSQVFSVLLRTGFGKWSLVDNDFLMPHNLARHQLDDSCVGAPKVLPLEMWANRLLGETDAAASVVTDVLSPGGNCDSLESELDKADIILDLSASVPVARHLARDRDDIAARRISAFLSPSGRDLVVLAEDTTRSIRLDSLEMQYYRALTTNPDLNGHLQMERARQRYGNSCRDLSHVIPQENVALHAAIAARAIRNIAEAGDPVIRVWRSDNKLAVNCVEIETSPTVEFTIGAGGWSLCTDEGVLSKVKRIRAENLPTETGGVIIGSIDMQRQIVYIADVLPAPPDSMQSSTGFIRGHEGLRPELDRISEASAGWLGYIGEWHSHPPGHSANQSGDDKLLFRWMHEHLSVEDHPPVMLIAGDDQKWYVAPSQTGNQEKE